MTFRADERITETSTTTGTGSYVLDGAATGFQAFSVLGSGNHCSYFATDDTSWEAGIGRVLIGPNRLERTHVLKSSTGTAAINWGAGTKTIRCGWIGALAIPRKLSKSIAGFGTTTLTQDEGLYDIIEFTGTLTGNRTIQVDSTPWVWQVFNNTTGAFTLTFKVAGLTGISISRGQRILAYCDGSDVRAMSAGAPFVDNEPIVVGSADATKKLRLEVDGFTTGTTRVATAPDADFTMVGVATTQTLTNKTLTSPTINTPTISGGSFSGTFTGTASGSTFNADSNTLTNVDQGNLKNNAHESSSIPGGTPIHVVNNAGQWGHFPDTRCSDGGAFSVGIVSGGTHTSFTTYTYHSAGGTTTVYARMLYHAGSPPYDLGDGEVPLFVFVLVDNATGKVIAASVGEDPPWANNGPTSIRVDFRDAQGRGWQISRPKINSAALFDPQTREAELAKIVTHKITPEYGALLGATAARDAEVSRLAAGGLQIIEVTQAVKQADMPLIPHNFIGNNLTGKTVVLLDPVSNMAETLLGLHQSGESVGEILHGDYLAIDNTPLVRGAPPGVLVSAVNWK